MSTVPPPTRTTLPGQVITICDPILHLELLLGAVTVRSGALMRNAEWLRSEIVGRSRDRIRTSAVVVTGPLTFQRKAPLVVEPWSVSQVVPLLRLSSTATFDTGPLVV